MNAKLYVGNLPYLTTDAELRTLFARAGTVAAVAVVKDRETGTSRGFGFVEMATRAEARNAIGLLDNYPLGEHTLTVNLTRPQAESRQQSSPLVSPPSHRCPSILKGAVYGIQIW